MCNMAKEWIKAADDDISAIAAMINNSDLTNIVAFHAQQAVEKSLKAVMEHVGESIPRKHDLLLLYSRVSGLINVEDESVLDTLNQLYTEARYPSEFGLMPNGKPSCSDAMMLSEFAIDIVRRAKSCVCGE